MEYYAYYYEQYSLREEPRLRVRGDPPTIFSLEYYVLKELETL